LEDWPAALEHYALACRLDPDEMQNWANLATASLAVDRPDEYARACTAMLNLAGPKPSREVTYQVLRACTDAPAPLETQRLTWLVERLGPENDKDQNYEALLARAYLRAGQIDLAIRHRRRSIELRGSEAAIDGFFLAVALSKLGKTDEARLSLGRARAQMALMAWLPGGASLQDRRTLLQWKSQAEQAVEAGGGK
jgi:tetratricopeptide (TPR) repeat protein